MNAAEREAARERQRELERQFQRLRQRALRTYAARAASTTLVFSVGFAWLRAIARHEPFSFATMGIAAGVSLAFAALLLGGGAAWDRWHEGHRHRAP